MSIFFPNIPGQAKFGPSNENFESDEAKVMFGTFVSLSPDDAGGGKIASLFASVIQDKGNNLMEFS